MTIAAIARAIGKAFIAFADELAPTTPARPSRDPCSTTAARADLAPRRLTGFAATTQADGCLCGNEIRDGVHTRNHCSLKPGSQP